MIQSISIREGNMNTNNPQEKRQGLSSAERQQIQYLLKFLATVLFCVFVASLATGLIISIFQNGG
jgi:hypothetical protein